MLLELIAMLFPSFYLFIYLFFVNYSNSASGGKKKLRVELKPKAPVIAVLRDVHNRAQRHIAVIAQRLLDRRFQREVVRQAPLDHRVADLVLPSPRDAGSPCHSGRSVSMLLMIVISPWQVSTSQNHLKVEQSTS